MRRLHAEERTNYPFTLSVDDLGVRYGLTAQAPARVGPARVCEYMQEALRSLVEALASAPDKLLYELEVLPQRERQQLLYGWNETQMEFPRESCVHELF